MCFAKILVFLGSIIFYRVPLFALLRSREGCQKITISYVKRTRMQQITKVIKYKFSK